MVKKLTDPPPTPEVLQRFWGALRKLRQKKQSVFISYSSRDREKARLISERLTATQSISVFLDVDQLAIDATKLSDALKSVGYYIILISESSNQSRWVKRETFLALEMIRESDLVLVPILLEDVEVPPEFRGLFHIDARKSFEKGLETLVEFFKNQDLSSVRLIAEMTSGKGSQTNADVRLSRKASRTQARGIALPHFETLDARKRKGSLVRPILRPVRG